MRSKGSKYSIKVDLIETCLQFAHTKEYSSALHDVNHDERSQDVTAHSLQPGTDHHGKMATQNQIWDFFVNLLKRVTPNGSTSTVDKSTGPTTTWSHSG